MSAPWVLVESFLLRGGPAQGVGTHRARPDPESPAGRSCQWRRLAWAGTADTGSFLKT